MEKFHLIADFFLLFLVCISLIAINQKEDLSFKSFVELLNWKTIISSIIGALIGTLIILLFQKDNSQK